MRADVNAHNFGRENTNIFIYNDKKIRLNPVKPSPNLQKRIRVLFKSLVKKPIIFWLRKFEKESWESRVMLVIIPRGEIHLISNFHDNPSPEIEYLMEEFKDVTPKDTTR